MGLETILKAVVFIILLALGAVSGALSMATTAVIFGGGLYFIGLIGAPLAKTIIAICLGAGALLGTFIAGVNLLLL